MDKMINSKKEKDSIYEIYRACRLCGGGAGYKMPIIQSIVELDGNDVELKQKIRDCVQIEVTQDDKMPPLICELCVDKVNDFYEFLEMCRQTNKRTRLRLGLPALTLGRGAAESGDCILGLTEPVFVEDSDEEDSKNKRVGSKTKLKKEAVVNLKVENLVEKRFSQAQKRDPTPPRTTRKKSKEDTPLQNVKEEPIQERFSRHKTKESTPPRVTRNRSRDDDMPLYCLKDSPKTLKTAPKSILKKESSYKEEEPVEERSSRHRKKESTPPRVTRNRSRDDDTPLNSLKAEEKPKALKRLPEKEIKSEPAKKVKISLKPVTSPPTKVSKSSEAASKSSLKTSTGPKSKTRPLRSSDPSPVKKPPSLPEKREPSPAKEYICEVCGHSLKTIQARHSHLRTHSVGFTNPKLACNPCGEWFPTQAESAAHHAMHKTKPYSCENCYSDFKTLSAFDDHLRNNECIPTYVAPDVKCDVCWHMFATYTLLYAHQCPGEDQRPGGECGRCGRSYTLHKNLVKHESTCTARKKGELIVDKNVMDSLKPLQIRLERCDSLVRNKRRNSYDYNSGERPFGSLLQKSGFRGMVKIHDAIKKAFCSQDLVDWDSAESGSENDFPILRKNTVHSLVALSLKTIFSQRLVGKVPRKKRKVKIDKVFDTLQADDDDLKIDIGNIIDKLCEDDNDDLITNESDDKMSRTDKIDDNINKNKSENYVTNSTKSNESDDSSGDKNDSWDKVNDKKFNNDSVSDYSLSNVEDSKDSLVHNNLNSTDKNNEDNSEDRLEEQCNNINDKNEVISKVNDNISKVSDNISNENNITNDKEIDLSDVLTKTVESETNLGINNFSFDTI